MRHAAVFAVAVLAVLAMSLVACEKLEIPDEDGENGGGQTELPDDGGGSGGDNDGGGGVMVGDTLTVAEAQLMMDCYVGVKGYIVGYIAGNQLSQSVFGVPEDAPNTNMLIADAPDVTDASLCVPVLLEPEEVRPMVNLYDHPDYYQCPVYVEGMVTTYFSVAGIRDVYAFILWDEYSPGLPDPGVEVPIVDPDTQHVTSGRGVVFARFSGNNRPK